MTTIEFPTFFADVSEISDLVIFRCKGENKIGGFQNVAVMNGKIVRTRKQKKKGGKD